MGGGESCKAANRWAQGSFSHLEPNESGVVEIALDMPKSTLRQAGAQGSEQASKGGGHDARESAEVNHQHDQGDGCVENDVVVQPAQHSAPRQFMVACFMRRILSTGSYVKHTDGGVMQGFPRGKQQLSPRHEYG